MAGREGRTTEAEGVWFVVGIEGDTGRGEGGDGAVEDAIGCVDIGKLEQEVSRGTEEGEGEGGETRGARVRAVTFVMGLVGRGAAGGGGARPGGMSKVSRFMVELPAGGRLGRGGSGVKTVS